MSRGMAYGRPGNRSLGMENAVLPGEPYGWNSTVFTTVEDFWDEKLMPNISVSEAYEKIRERILHLNPEAQEKDIKKFIG